MKIPLTLPTEHPVYAGHFPGHPLVPGALLIAWIASALQRERVAVGSIDTCKFLLPVVPGSNGNIHVAQSGRKAVAEFEVDGRTCVRLTFREIDDGPALAE